MDRRLLHAYVFCTGAAVLALEISASRLLAPSFGTSLFVWGNIIGIVLGALALGYYFGGRLADRSPTAEALGAVTWCGGILTCAIPLFAPVILHGITEAFFGVPLFLIIASFAAMMLLFALPLMLLGALSPLATRIGAHSLEEVGSVSGSLSAAATAGSLFGAFIPSFLTIPLLGTRATILGAGAILIVLGSAALRKKACLLGLLLPIAVLALAGLPANAWRGLVYEKESPYQYIRVVQTDDGQRLLIANEGLGIQTLSLKPDGLTGSYTDAMATVPYLLTGRGPLRILVIGMGGGSMIRQFRRFAPEGRAVSIEAAEIDPEMPKVARAYFGLAPGDADVHVADGRTFLSQTDKTYDLIVVDAYHDELYVPFHLATVEFFGLVRRHLAPGGMAALNVIGTDDTDPLLVHIRESLRADFPFVESARLDPSFNHLVIGSASPIGLDRLAGVPETLRPSAAQIENGAHPVDAAAHLLTDDRAPVEYLTDRFALRAARTYLASSP